MIDFHAHILPGMDDGSRDVKQSLRMLQSMAAQGVDTVVATSHYYRKENTPAEFAARRQAAFNRLCEVNKGDLPRILPGAEVAYFPEIGACADLELLCIEGTRTLLLEMPFCRWDDAILGDVLALTTQYAVVLAHIERYWFMQPKRIRERILHSACRLQVNTMGLCIWPLSIIERNGLRCGAVQVIGSDCHGRIYRPPCAGWAWKRMEKCLGAERLREIDAGMRELLK